MGIDIRDGQQLECITCALCIDACDDVMWRLNRPRGLIDYLALSDQSREIAGGAPRPVWRHVLRPRTMVYTALWALIGIGLVYALFVRSEVEFTVAPVRNPVFVTLADGSLRNIYEFRLRNKTGMPVTFQLGVDSTVDDMQMLVNGVAGTTVTVAADSISVRRVYLDVPASSEATKQHVSQVIFWIDSNTDDDRHYVQSVFNGRERR
jgi:polyferredoxin